MLRKLTQTDNSTGTTIIRVLLGLVFFAHGAQKMLGWFGVTGSQEPWVPSPAACTYRPFLLSSL
jgi:uncharacterized membrane protein YphA (DoxX/SURF4 family)